LFNRDFTSCLPLVNKINEANSQGLESVIINSTLEKSLHASIEQLVNDKQEFSKNTIFVSALNEIRRSEFKDKTKQNNLNRNGVLIGEGEILRLQPGFTELNFAIWRFGSSRRTLKTLSRYMKGGLSNFHNIKHTFFEVAYNGHAIEFFFRYAGQYAIIFMGSQYNNITDIFIHRIKVESKKANDFKEDPRELAALLEEPNESCIFNDRKRSKKNGSRK